MNIDEKIKHQLESDAAEIDQILAEDRGLFEKVMGIYTGNRRLWNNIIYVYGLTFGVAMFWTGYRFYVAQGVSDQLFWGVSFLATLILVVVSKLWMFMEMNQSNSAREIKRLELAITRLEVQLRNK